MLRWIKNGKKILGGKIMAKKNIPDQLEEKAYELDINIYKIKIEKAKLEIKAAENMIKYLNHYKKHGV